MKPVKIFLQPRRNFREASTAVLTIVSNIPSPLALVCRKTPSKRPNK
jgi:hypothetical protein